MSYQPYNRNTSGIVFFGEQGSQQTYYSDSNFLIEDGAAGNIQAPNFKVANNGNIGSVGDPTAIAIASNGNVTMSKSLSITGDLTVNGTTTTVNSNVTTIEDPVIIIGSGAGDGYGGSFDDNKDRGLAFAWRETGDPNGKLGFIGHDDSIKRFVYYTSGTMTNDVFSNGVLGDAEFRWGKFTGVSGELAGNASTATEATNVTVTANNTTNETVYLTFVDGATGTQGIETDTALSYNPSTDTLTAGTFAGNLTGNVTGSADTLTNPRYIGVSGQVVGSGAFNGSADIVVNTDLTLEAIRDQTEKSSAAVAADYILVMDSEDSDNLKKISRSNFISGLGGFSNFTVSDRVTTGTVDDGEQLIFTDGPTINFTVAAEGSNHTISGVVVDASIDANKLATSVAGLGITGGGGTALAFAPSELTDAAIANGDSLVFMDTTDSNAPKVEALADVATLFAGVGLSATNSVLAVNAGNGLVANGDNIDVDLSDFSVVTLASGDSFATLDSNGTTEQRTTIMDLGAYLAGGAGSNITVNGSGQLFVSGGTTFTIQGDTGSETVGNGDTITFAGSNGLDVAVSATDTVTYTIDISEYGTQPVAASDSFMVLDSDGSTHQRATIDQLGTYLAGTNITNTAGVLSVPDTTIDGVVFEAANFVDGTTIDFTVTAGTSVTAEVIDSTITEGKRFRDVQAVAATSATITGDIVTVDAATAGGNVTLTLPSHSEGRIIHIKKIDSGANTVSTSTVDGGTLTLYSQNESATIFSTGSAWYII